ncbi:MAG: hypothetical protein AB8D52_03110 [Gammaproteobacteria bacterium]
MNTKKTIINKGFYVALVSLPVAAIGILILQKNLPMGPIVLAMTVIPIMGLLIAKREVVSAVPDLIFGAIDTGLLTIPVLAGGITFGVAGAVAGGVIGDALSDGIAGFFEGSIAEWLREKGIEESRESVTTGLGKMAGCLLGSGLVLSIALLFGIDPGR